MCFSLSSVLAFQTNQGISTLRATSFSLCPHLFLPSIPLPPLFLSPFSLFLLSFLFILTHFSFPPAPSPSSPPSSWHHFRHSAFSPPNLHLLSPLSSFPSPSGLCEELDEWAGVDGWGWRVRRTSNPLSETQTHLGIVWKQLQTPEEPSLKLF